MNSTKANSGQSNGRISSTQLTLCERSFGNDGFRPSSNRDAFTLVELLVVIAIIGVLVSLLLPAVQAAREAARRAQCVNQIKQIGLAMLNYESTFKNFPEGTRTDGGYNCNIAAGTFNGSGNRCQNGPSWAILLLPYLEQQALFDQFDLKQPFPYLYNGCGTVTTPPAANQVNIPLMKTPLGIWHCPSDFIALPGTPYACYHACTGGGDWTLASPNAELAYACKSFTGTPQYLIFTNGITGYDSKTKFGQISDGASNTFLIGENRMHFQSGSHGSGDPEQYTGWSSTFDVTSGFAIPHTASAAARPINFSQVTGDEPILGSGSVPWYSPGLRATQFGSHHPGGAHFCLADGSARFVTEDIDDLTYWSYGRMADGLKAGELP